MKKMTATALLAGASLLALSGTASALDINVYGASAQYTFWQSVAPAFLQSQGCTAGSIVKSATSDGKHGITYGTGTGACAGGISLRYSSKASYDGIRAVKGSCVGDHTSCVADPDGCGSPFQRKMITSHTNNALVCKPVTIGASDVDGPSFTQQSHGQLKGPNGGGNVDRVFSGITIPSNVVKTQSIVVPFGFFVNNDVTVNTCSSSAAANKGLQCVSDADCGGSAGACTSTTLDNVSRPMAANIFSGNSWYWSDFGAGFNGNPITACLRHAGSGTHSTLDYAVMNSKWGADLVSNESAIDPIIWFNDGSSDEMKCINGLSGAIGYADADQLTGSGATTYPNVAATRYQGFEPKRVNIRNGLYDFWSTQWLYINGSNYGSTSPERAMYNALLAYAANPANISTATVGAKADYWAAKNEMVYMKGNDQGYPAYQGATTPMTP